MTVRSTHKQIGRLLAVIVAGAVFGVTGTIAIAASQPAQLAPRQQHADLGALAEWARAQHLTGLSPASLAGPRRNLSAAVRTVPDPSTIAQFAEAEGLSGLSPASLHRVHD
jgi:hypothetical protein